MFRSIKFWLVLVVVIVISIPSFVFTVSERELVVKFNLGEFVRADYTPGLYWKLPIVNNVRRFDRRILTLDAAPERYLTVNKKNVMVDSFVKWRIANVENYYRTTSGDERRAGLRLSQLVKDGLRSEFGKRTIQEVISESRDDIMAIITKQMEASVEPFGIEVVDVRIKRIELPAEVSNSVYRRMEAERSRVASEFRSEGAKEAERIRAGADKTRSVTLANAYSEAETLRGEGDAEASRIYADAYGSNADFYSLYRSLEAYKKVFSSRQDLLVLDPSSEFFDYFKAGDAR